MNYSHVTVFTECDAGEHRLKTEEAPSSINVAEQRLKHDKAQRIADAIAGWSEYDVQVSVTERLKSLRNSQLDILERVLDQYGSIIDPGMLVNEFLASVSTTEIEHNFAMLKMAMALNRTNLQMHAICELPAAVRETGLPHGFPLRPEHIALVIRASATPEEWEDELYEYAMENLDRIKKVGAAVASLRNQGAPVSPDVLADYMVHQPVMFAGVL